MSVTDRRAALFASYAHAAHLVAGTSGDQLDRPTPCPKFPVSTLLSHLVGAGWRAVALGRGESPTGEEFPPVALADAAGELRRAGAEAEVVWSNDTSLVRTVAMPWGETYTGATLVDMYLAEIAAHSFDLAAATGQLDRLEPNLAVAALAGARAMLKPEYRDAMGPGEPFGPEVEAPADASDWERFAAFMGRSPLSWRAVAA